MLTLRRAVCAASSTRLLTSISSAPCALKERLLKVYYTPDYVAASYGFDTTRKASRVAAMLHDRPLPGVRVVQPEPATRSELRLAHTSAYVDCVLNGGGYPGHPRRHKTSGFPWSRGLVKAVRASTGGVIDALSAALREGVAGSLSSGLHHAHADSGGGFCTFNGLAVAALAALQQGAVRRLLILDLDAHYGDGTMDILGDDPRVDIIDFCTDRDEGFELLRGRHPVVGFDDGASYLPAVRSLLGRYDASKVDLVLYNAGMDPHEDCDIGGAPGVDSAMLRQREELVFQWCRDHQVPVAFVLAGGYAGRDLSDDELAALHYSTVAAAVG